MASSPRAAEEADVSFQVFSPDALPEPRPLAARVTDAELPSSKMSLGVRVCLFLLGVCVVVLSAAAIVAVSTDDPPAKATSKPAAPVLVSTGTLPLVDPASTTGLAAPPPVAVAPVETSPPSVVVASSALAPSTSGTTKRTAPKGSAPAGIKGAAPPPNPYSGTTPSKPSGAGKKPVAPPNPF